MRTLLRGLAGLAALLSLGGCFFWHTVEHDDRPVEHTTTVVTP